MTKKIYNVCILSLISAVLSGCIDKDLYQPQSNPKPISEYFDFSTIENVRAYINYGEMAGGTLVEIFTANPLSDAGDGTLTPNATPAYMAHLDSNGCLDQDICLPAGCEQVYVCANSYVAPMVMTAKVNNHGFRIVTQAAAETRSAGATRLASDLQLYPVSGTTLYSLFSGNDEYGSIKGYDTNGVLSQGNLNANFYTSLQYVLWGGKTYKPSGLNNRTYAVGSEVVNTTVLHEGVDPATGELTKIESANLFFTFVGEAAWNENTVGYYYYDTANPPANASQLKKIVILPNSSLPMHQPFGKGTITGSRTDYEDQYAPASSNMKIQLLYQDADGNVTPDFPAGVTVGFFVMANAFSNHSTGINAGATCYYSNESLNSNGEKRVIALEAKDGSLVYGFEDSSSDFSADDVLFTISASPNYALQKSPDLPQIDVDLNEQITYTTYDVSRTYAYEDIWPDGGDYDLNDVIVEHKREVTFNQKNFVSEVKDEFTAVQPSGAANYTNAFAVQYDPNLREYITLPEGSVDEKETSSVIVLTNANAKRGKTLTITRTFTNSLSTGLNKKIIEDEDLNPYIISQYVAGASVRAEVHLPKHAGTMYQDNSLVGASDDAYYINKDGKHPFAIELPITGWTPAPETTSVSSAFPGFDGWVNSNGSQNTDWYLGN